MTGRYGLLGERLTHSFSPFIHAELGSYEYNLFEKKPEELDSFIKGGDFDGLNVTIPYKKIIVPYCGNLSETARVTGSVNTVTRLSDGSLYGDNTDFFGFAYLLKKININPATGKTIILGNGGSSRTVQAVLKNMNAEELVVVERNGNDNYENIEKHRDAQIIINTTPVGMYPDNGFSPIIGFGVFQNCKAVIDLIYNPARTELMLQAEERGIINVNGLSMLVSQAKKSAEIFFNASRKNYPSSEPAIQGMDAGSIPDEKTEEIVLKITKMTRNIILIGMPGCGKSSIGKALAEKTGRSFADTDEWIVKTAGKSIPDILVQDGENTFRMLEIDSIKALCKERSLIIATGGGIVKRNENRRVLGQNGIIVYLDRDIADLPVTGRPLSEKEGLKALAAARLPLYKEWCEYTVPVRGVEQTTEALYLKFFV